MKHKYKLIFLVGFALVFLVNPLFAGQRVDGDELKSLITGKTLEGRWILWASSYRVYLDPDGSFSRVFGKGGKFGENDSGRWWVNKKGKLCYEVRNKACRRVKRRSDGGYNLFNKKKVLKQTIEKITDGNPYKL
jgi:hypothetical protein